MVGRVDDVDVVLDDGPGVVVGQRRPQSLGPARLRSQLGLQQAARGPARAETGNPHLAGDALEGRLDLGLELGLVQLDGQLDAVVGERLDAAAHGRECTGAARAHYADAAGGDGLSEGTIPMSAPIP